MVVALGRLGETSGNETDRVANLIVTEVPTKIKVAPSSALKPREPYASDQTREHCKKEIVVWKRWIAYSLPPN